MAANLALLLGILSTAALAQTGTITGTITGPDGGSIRDALIQATNSASGAAVRGTSSFKGEYSVALPAGTYDLAVVRARESTRIGGHGSY